MELVQFLLPLIQSINENPLPEISPDISYPMLLNGKEATLALTPTVLDAISPELENVYEDFFEKGTVDLVEGYTKAYGDENGIKLGAPNNPAEIETIAHELGHSLALIININDKDEVKDYTTALGETSSITAEVLATRDLYERGIIAKLLPSRFAEVNKFCNESRYRICLGKMLDEMGIDIFGASDMEVGEVVKAYMEYPNKNEKLLSEFSSAKNDNKKRFIKNSRQHRGIESEEAENKRFEEISQSARMETQFSLFRGESYPISVMLGMIFAKKIRAKEFTLKDVCTKMYDGKHSYGERLGNLGVPTITDDMVESFHKSARIFYENAQTISAWKGRDL